MTGNAFENECEQLRRMVAAARVEHAATVGKPNVAVGGLLVVMDRVLDLLEQVHREVQPVNLQ